jgi:hypothetical protein
VRNLDNANALALELRTMYLAVMDLDRSMDGCKLFQSHIQKRNDSALFWPAISDSIIVNYGKPFRYSCGYSKPLPDHWPKFADPYLTELHHRLPRLRDKTVAHSDEEACNITIQPITDWHVPLENITLTRECLTTDEIPALRVLGSDLERQLMDRAIEIFEKLNPGKSCPLRTRLGEKRIPGKRTEHQSLP